MAMASLARRQTHTETQLTEQTKKRYIIRIIFSIMAQKKTKTTIRPKMIQISMYALFLNDCPRENDDDDDENVFRLVVEWKQNATTISNLCCEWS